MRGSRRLCRSRRPTAPSTSRRWRPWKDEQQDLLQYQVAQQITMQRAQRVLADYFSLDAVKRRLNYANPNEKPTQTASAT